MRDSHKLSTKVKLGYGVGSLSYGIPFQLVSALFVFFSTEVLGLSGVLTGVLVFVSTIWDAVTDPIMGYISDHTNKKILLGRRLFYVLIGAIGLALCSLLLWQVDASLPYLTKAAILGVLLILLKTFSTVYTTPYMALGAELSSDYNERTAVQSFRTAFFFLGFMFPTIVGMAVFFRPTPQFENGQLNPQAYASLSICTAVITLVCAAICIALTYRHQAAYSAPKVKRNPINGIFKETAEALKCNDFRNVSLSLLFINMAMGIVGSVGMHVFTYTFSFNNRQIAIVFGALFVMALIAQPFWLFIANKFEKKTALKACIIINIGVTLLFALAVIANSWISDHYLVVLPLSMLMGLSMGGSIALPYSMITDTIDKDAYYSGTRKEGVFYGCATFMFKLSQSLSAIFVGSLLDIIHFDSKIVQAPAVYLKLGMILPVGFLICFVLALIFLSKYTLNRVTVAKYQADISGNMPQ
jgi:Na+/melibiose symporter-like transporter